VVSTTARTTRHRRLVAATFAHEPELVWRALADDALLAEWLDDADVQPRVGHRFTVGRPPLPIEVTRVERPHRLEVQIVGGHAAGTSLVWTLDEAGAGTRLTLEERCTAGAGAGALGLAVAVAWRVRLRRRLERCLAAHADQPLAVPLL
jgi:uncharacterized protein YndB with AHSA1/START domain